MNNNIAGTSVTPIDIDNNLFTFMGWCTATKTILGTMRGWYRAASVLALRVSYFDFTGWICCSNLEVPTLACEAPQQFQALGFWWSAMIDSLIFEGAHAFNIKGLLKSIWCCSGGTCLRVATQLSYTPSIRCVYYLQMFSVVYTIIQGCMFITYSYIVDIYTLDIHYQRGHSDIV